MSKNFFIMTSGVVVTFVNVTGMFVKTCFDRFWENKSAKLETKFYIMI